jgi:hypothetical protein
VTELDPKDYWRGIEPRECGEHRTTGHRAWCFDCSEWCYEAAPCKGCQIPVLESGREVDKQISEEILSIVNDLQEITKEREPNLRRLHAGLMMIRYHLYILNPDLAPEAEEES